MSIFAISDLHLPLGIPKSMDIFGWGDYVSIIKENWERNITDEDVVLIPGDISWATYLEQAEKDFEFLSLLPGLKIISKGNHDFWWNSKTKMNLFLKGHGFDRIIFLQNECYVHGTVGICASRGWISPSDPGFTDGDLKIYNRELQRLRLSIGDAVKRRVKNLVVMLHYPPNDGFLDILGEVKPECCVYGHIHGIKRPEPFPGHELRRGVRCINAAADYINFSPSVIY